MASSSSSSLTSHDENFRKEVLKEMRNHEIAIGELNSLSASREKAWWRDPNAWIVNYASLSLDLGDCGAYLCAVYQKIGNIYFRRSIENAKTFEGKKLEAAKAQFQKLNAA